MNILKYTSAVLLTTLFICILSEQAEAQWSHDPTVNSAVCTATGDQERPKVCGDGAGGTIITWLDGLGIYAQRINASGVVQWAVNGVTISTWPVFFAVRGAQICSDGAGGAIITWQDHRGQTSDIYAQRINASGFVQWAVNGIPISTATGNQMFPEVCSDGTGGAIIAWEDHMSGDNRAQRINSSGVVQWQVNGIAICTLYCGLDPFLCTDGAGGAIITVFGGNSSGTNSIRAQRINAAGAVQWESEGIAICTPPSAPNWWRQQCSDGAGGAIITWSESPPGTYGIYAQRINALGVVQWAVNGIPISTTTGVLPQLCSDGAGGAIITWSDGSGIYTQRINLSGVVQWTANGVAICTTPGTEGWPQLCSDGAGGAIITWQDNRGGSADMYAQRINASGVVQWPVNGIPICTAPNDQGDPQICGDGAGGAIVAWTDHRSGANSDIYAQNIDRFGNFSSVTKMYLRDNGGDRDSLEWGTAAGATDGIDAAFGEYELPPLPPTGVFDVRWRITGTQGTKRDIRDTLGGTRTQVTYRGLMQPGSGGYPFTLRWNRMGLPLGTFTLRDELGGTSFVVNMKQQDSLVITDPSIVSFRIIYDRRPIQTQSLFIRDNAGWLDLLEYGTAAGATDGIDGLFGESELPPLPPTGVFDVRWRITGTQGTKLDVRDTLGGTRTQVVYRGLMQPSDPPGGYPFTLKWNRSALPTGTFTLRDEIGGSSFVVNMKHQDSLVITNPDIVSFRIIHDRRPTQKLFIRDISERADSLEYGTAEGATDSIDWLFGESELPPLPPTGVFDVRWKITGTQGTKLDVRDTLGGTRTQAIYRGLIQPSDPPGGYPFTLKWNKSEFPAGTFTLRDAPGGTRFAVDMKQQDSVVITDSDIASFQIIFDRRPAFYCAFQQGWNIMSLPLTVDDRRKNWLFTGSNSNAFAYLPSGYVVRDTLQNGIGYWLKFPSAQDIGITGTVRMRDTVAVAVGWNMIGAIADSVDVTTIQQIPPTIIASQIYGYNAGYSVTTMLLPSRGYWVKTIASGLLILSSASGLNKGALSPSYALDRAATITISDSRVATQTLCFTSELIEKKDLDFFELPPPPPAGTFNARFSTNRVLEAVKEGESKMIPIQISDAQYPLTIRWEMKDQSLTASLMIGTTEVPMSSNGSVTVSDSKAPISLKLGGYSSLPKEFALFQNYPNPFNPSTTIKYDLPIDSRVSLKLFNILGQEVTTLVNEEQKAGYRSVQWNASNVASGVYFYRIQAGDFVASKKLLLLR